LDKKKRAGQTYIILKSSIREGESMKKSLFTDGEEVKIKESGETVTIFKSQYVKNMKRYSYTVNEYPSTFFFEEELTKE
jgi:hypothetical protein